jgi:hypothetical protein
MLRHVIFLGNNYFIAFLKLPITQHRQLILLNDFATFLCCFPRYFILTAPALANYFGYAKNFNKSMNT